MIPRRKSRKVSPYLIAACAVTGLVACKKPEPPVPPPPVVEVLTVEPQDVPIMRTWVGSMVGEVDASISAQVNGYLLEQNYINGAYVDQGAVMFQIDPRPFEASLNQAQGTLAQAEAQLKAALLTAQRANELFAKQVISQEQFDDQTQAYFAAKATAESAQAAVDQAQLNLGFTRITSPISGIASIAAAQVGDLVGPGTGVLATVTQVDPIKVNFGASEQEYINFIQRFFDNPSAAPMAAAPEPGRTDGPGMELVLTLANGTVFPQKGQLIAVNNTVAQNTGTIELQGSFPNPGNLLRPGQFALVSAIVHMKPNAIVIPQRAVANLQGQNQIYVVEAGNKVSIRNVEMGDRVGSDWIVESGIQGGDTIIVQGLQKVRDGSVVNPQPYTLTEQERQSLENPLPVITRGTMPEAIPSASPVASPAVEPIPTPPPVDTPTAEDTPEAVPGASPASVPTVAPTPAQPGA